MKRAPLFIVLFGLAMLASACGGGGGGGSSPLPHSNNAPQATTGAVVHVVIPNGAGGTSARKPAYISPNTATITIGVYTVNGATPSPLPTPLSITIATSPSCTTVSGSTSCTITVIVPIATGVVLQFSSYDASGNLLGQALIGPIDTALATIPQQSVSVGGVPASLRITPSGLSAGDDGLIHPIPFGVIALDADGNTIVPPGAYPNPIALSISGDTNSALSLSATSVASPGTTVTLSYNSARAITTATVTATYGTITASAPFAPIVFTPTSAPLQLGGSMQSVTVSEAGYAGAFTLQGASSTVATATCVPANCTPSSAGGTVTIDIAPGSATGSESLSVLDANGGFANIPVTLTSSGGGGALVGPPYSVYEYPTQTSGANYGITVGPDGQTLWFVDQVNASLGAISNPSACNSTTCAYTESPVPWQSAPPTNLLAITPASDGNLYITDVGNGSSDYGNVFQVACTPSPASCAGTSYPNYDFIDNYPANLTDVVAGPDGNLYISGSSDSGDNSGIAWEPIVGFSSYSYEVQVAPSPSAINMMTFDQGGQTLWFTDSGNANIGFIAGLPCEVACNATEQPSGTTGNTSYGPQGGAAHRPPPGGIAKRVRMGSGSRPTFVPRRRRNVTSGPGQTSFVGPLEGIVAAPDGNLYVADAGGGVIDQISPSTWLSCSGNCTFLAIGLPNPSAVPMNLTIGRDGNVWFTDANGYVGFVALNTCSSSSCKVYEYKVPNTVGSLPPAAVPWGITSGPDGNIWFTYSSINAIGKVVL